MDENVREMLHKSKLESALLWAHMTRQQEDAGNGTNKLEQVRWLFQSIKDFKKYVSINPDPVRESQISRWDRRRLDR